MTAPAFRQVCQLTGDIAESPIDKMLAAANEISGQAAEVKGLRAENIELSRQVDRLREENSELRARIDELTAEAAWAAEVGPAPTSPHHQAGAGHPNPK